MSWTFVVLRLHIYIEYLTEFTGHRTLTPGDLRITSYVHVFCNLPFLRGVFLSHPLPHLFINTPTNYLND